MMFDIWKYVVYSKFSSLKALYISSSMYKTSYMSSLYSGNKYEWNINYHVFWYRKLSIKSSNCDTSIWYWVKLCLVQIWTIMSLKSYKIWYIIPLMPASVMGRGYGCMWCHRPCLSRYSLPVMQLLWCHRGLFAPPLPPAITSLKL